MLVVPPEAVVLSIEDPVVTFHAWYADARAREPDVPDAMSLATVGPDGRPALRMVLVKEVDAHGIVFVTNYESRKGRDLDARPWATVCFHWKTMHRQIIAEGRVERMPEAWSDVYFGTRPRGSQIGAWASRQDRPLVDRQDLEEAVREVEARYAGAEVPRPPWWGGYRIVPDRWEFWQARVDRLHDRVELTREVDPASTGGGRWVSRLLSP